MEDLKNIKKQIVSCVQSQVGGNLAQVDTKELGEAVDMIKDLSEAIYYCSIVKAMEENTEEQKIMKKIEPMLYDRHYYTQYRYLDYRYPDYRYEDYPYGNRDRQYGKLYYTGGRGGNNTDGNNSNSNGGSNNTGGRRYNEIGIMRDSREGRSPGSRRSYMESKEMHHTKEQQMQELDKYMQELAMDITEMIEDASAEEKIILQQKLSNLVTKIK